MKFSIGSQKGFSLVELMVVVAIIGILAAIAVPNYQKFAAKSKQAEAQANLSALYSAERSFYSEWNTFYGDFTAIGYAPTGKLLYSHGFTADGGTLPANYPVTTITNNFSSAVYCATTTAGNANYCLDPGTAFTGSITPTTTAFTAAAAGNISTASGNIDKWTIDQSKVVSNIQVGY